MNWESKKHLISAAERFSIWKTWNTCRCSLLTYTRLIFITQPITFIWGQMFHLCEPSVLRQKVRQPDGAIGRESNNQLGAHSWRWSWSSTRSMFWFWPFDENRRLIAHFGVNFLLKESSRQIKGLGAPCREKPLEKSGLEPAAPNRLANRKHCALSTRVSFECPYQHPPWSPVSIGKPAPKIHQWTKL